MKLLKKFFVELLNAVELLEELLEKFCFKLLKEFRVKLLEEYPVKLLEEFLVERREEFPVKFPELPVKS